MNDSPKDTDRGGIELPRLRVTREVPMWGILSVLGAACAQAVATYYGQQSMAAEQARQTLTLAEIRAEQKSLTSDIRRNDLATTELKYQYVGLEQRVRLIEASPARVR